MKYLALTAKSQVARFPKFGIVKFAFLLIVLIQDSNEYHSMKTVPASVCSMCCEWSAVRMRRPGKSIRRSFFVGAAMRSNATAVGRGRRSDQLVGGMKQCLGRSSCNRRTARPRCGRLPTVPLIGKAMFVSSVGRSVGREAWIRQNLIRPDTRTVAVHLLMGLPPHQY